jgi:hypothetical protein
VSSEFSAHYLSSSATLMHAHSPRSSPLVVPQRSIRQSSTSCALGWDWRDNREWGSSGLKRRYERGCESLGERGRQQRGYRWLVESPFLNLYTRNRELAASRSSCQETRYNKYPCSTTNPLDLQTPKQKESRLSYQLFRIHVEMTVAAPIHISLPDRSKAEIELA